MKPRTAGILGMTAGLVTAIIAGAMIADPQRSLAGAIILVGGTILFSVAATWTVRKSWDRAEWPTVSVAEEVSFRRLRRLAIFECAVAPLAIGAGVWQVLVGQFGWFHVLSGVLFLAWSIHTLRVIAKRTAENDGDQPAL